MHLNTYQVEAMEYRLPSATPEYAILSLSAEVGELHTLISKSIRDGRKFDHDQNVKKELGDILWNVAAVALDHGFTLEDIAYGNLNKLESRKQRNVLQGSGDNR